MRIVEGRFLLEALALAITHAKNSGESPFPTFFLTLEVGKVLAISWDRSDLQMFRHGLT